jgi:hypothetical protein
VNMRLNMGRNDKPHAMKNLAKTEEEARYIYNPCKNFVVILPAGFLCST